MAQKLINRIANFQQTLNQAFLDKAQSLKPELFKTKVVAKALITYALNDQQQYEIVSSSEWTSNTHSQPLSKGQKIVLDFGEHCVGYLSFHLQSVGSPMDAPTHLRIKLGERLCELGIASSSYQGRISSSWIQEEFMHIDVLPETIHMPRRYAFRYVEIEVLDTSPKYEVVFSNFTAEHVCSVPVVQRTSPLPALKPEYAQNTALAAQLVRLDEVGLKTLCDCMQEVFEDGPKRDRRLWIGDLRLQAQTNYLTVNHNDLVKRCLYLFAGAVQNEGRVGANLFMQPQVQVDDTYLFDYALFFISCLDDYFKATGDQETLDELYPTAIKQAEICAQRLDEHNLIKDENEWWCFVDWQDKLNKQASAQAIFIFALKQAVHLSEVCSLPRAKEDQVKLNHLIDVASKAALDKLFDTQSGLFISGPEHQISIASQAWMALAGVLNHADTVAMLSKINQLRLNNDPTVVGMVTPYMYHHLVEAMFLYGMYDEAVALLCEYWGAMLQDGADCYYELFDPKNPDFSPYGSPIINSYCHAWSCTPSYFIRKYLCETPK